MNHWPYIIVSYVLTLGGMAVLTLISWARMLGAEARASELSRPSASGDLAQRPKPSLGTSDGGAAKLS